MLFTMDTYGPVMKKVWTRPLQRELRTNPFLKEVWVPPTPAGGPPTPEADTTYPGHDETIQSRHRMYREAHPAALR